jgi:glycosyltransferase involved in cell wall biosynthesis
VTSELDPGRPRDPTWIDLDRPALRWRGRIRDARDAFRHASPAFAKELIDGRRAARADKATLLRARAGRDVCWVDDEATPLVTVRITTVGRLDLLLQRALPSVLRQTHENLDILVVGDGCDDEVGRRIAAIGDPRIRFENIVGPRPTSLRGKNAWLVSGSNILNAALDLAHGQWLAPCDDDDEITPDHVEVLLREARQRRLEFVHSRTLIQLHGGRQAVIGSRRMSRGQVTHGAVLYSMGLRDIRYRATSYRRREPIDYNLFRRFEQSGVRMGYVDRVTYVYYPSPFSLQEWESVAARYQSRPK